MYIDKPACLTIRLLYMDLLKIWKWYCLNYPHKNKQKKQSQPWGHLYMSRSNGNPMLWFGLTFAPLCHSRTCQIGGLLSNLTRVVVVVMMMMMIIMIMIRNRIRIMTMMMMMIMMMMTMANVSNWWLASNLTRASSSHCVRCTVYSVQCTMWYT